MSKFSILAGWASVQSTNTVETKSFRPPRSASVLALETRLVRDLADAEELVLDLSRLRLGAIAIDTEFKFRAGLRKLSNGAEWIDIRQLQPLILSGAAWVPDEGKAVRFLFDLREPGVKPYVEKLLKLRVPFVAHNIKAELQTFWAMGLDVVFPQIWCTYIAARALSLGIRTDGLSLEKLCEANGIDHQFFHSKQALQRSFLSQEQGQPFTSDQLEYALADAEATLELYLAQQEQVLAAGLHSQLMTVEFPFAQANARIEWDGAPFDLRYARKLRLGLERAVDHHRNALKELGLANPSSSKQTIEFLSQRGHREQLHKKGKLSSEDAILEGLEARDDAVKHIRRYRQYSKLKASPLLLGEQVGEDDRIHPKHMQLGATTGRSTCSAPNLAGVSKTFRPLVRVEKDRRIFEADFSQIEVGVTAAEYGDLNLVAAFNSGDVYAGIAQKMFAHELSEEERAISTEAFKLARPDLRGLAKIFVLATTYGMSDQTIAAQFGFSIIQAVELKQSYFATFPSLKLAADAAGIEGQIKGFSPMVGGLRRNFSSDLNNRNQHMNTPIQGSAGVVFRRAVAELHSAFRGSSSQIILPVHDAVVIECSEEELSWAAKTTSTIMEASVRTYYPQLVPRVDINCSNPHCWNKDGRSDSIDRFLDDPTFKL